MNDYVIDDIDFYHLCGYFSSGLYKTKYFVGTIFNSHYHPLIISDGVTPTAYQGFDGEHYDNPDDAVLSYGKEAGIRPACTINIECLLFSYLSKFHYYRASVTEVMDILLDIGVMSRLHSDWVAWIGIDDL